MFSFLSVGWGLISDIDIESERLRLIGYPRFTLWSIHRLINLRTYHGTVSYLPASDFKMDQTPQPNRFYKTNLKHSMSCGNTLECLDCSEDGDCEACDTGFGDVLSLETSGGAGATESFRPRCDSWYSANSRKSAYFSTSDSFYQSVAEKTSNGSGCMDSTVPAQMYGPAAKIPSLITPVPDSWTIETGQFLMVHAVSQTHISSDCFFAPSSALNDGVIWLCIIRGGASRKELLKFFLGMSSGTHLPTVPSEYISMIPVMAFRIDPIIDSSEEKYGHLTVDGEKVEYGPIQGEVFPSIAKVMVPNFSL